MEEYDILVLGEEVVDGHRNVNKLFHDLKYAVLEASEDNRNRFWRENMQMGKGMLALKSKKEIEMCASSLFVALVRKNDNVTLNLLMQPSYEAIQDALFPCLGQKKQSCENRADCLSGTEGTEKL